MKFNSVFRWETVLKLAAILSIIWISIQLVNYFSSSTEKISATIKSSAFYLPATIVKNMFTYLPTEINDSLFELNSGKVNSLKQYKESTFQLGRIKQFRDYLTSKITNLDYYKFKEYRYLWTINISNHSSLTVQSINVDIDEDGFYQLISQENNMTSAFYNHNILIGELRPQNKVTLFIWSIYPSEVAKVKINHKDGFLIPEQIKEVTGFYSWLTKYTLTENIFLRLFPFLLVCFWGFYLILTFTKNPTTTT